MKTFSFRTLVLCLSLLLAAVSLPLAASAANPIKVTIDGQSLGGNAAPVVAGGVTLVAYDDLAAKLGATASLDAKTKKLSFKKGATTLQFTVGSNQALVNGQSVAIGTKVVSKNGRTLVPFGLIGKSLGAWVNWDASSRTASIETKRAIKHAMGETTLTSVPKRVVVLVNGVVDISLTLGVKPVGAVESWVQAPWYDYLRADMSGVKNLGSELQPNIEAIVALKPDLIVGAKTRHEKIYSQLSKIAPTLYVDQLFEWKSNLDLVAKAVNKEPVAAAFMSDWNKQVADIKSKLGGKATSEVSIVRFYDDGTARIYVTGFAGSILDEVGLNRPKSQRDSNKTFVDLDSQEQIPLMNGDIIFDITSSNHGGDEFKTQEEWQKNPLWSNLKAVQNKKYYQVNDVTWNLSGGATAAKMMLDDLYFYLDL
ncbi:ABC transporter substrate-binding protein [Cohnella sp. GCM10027633]|uniref:ABC transporter substrate-binding protein n=1 Tax=unclassified Cohnella TaxID=2636738 RepID=UPI00363E7860